MANFTRTQLDAVWISGYQPPDSDFEDLDRKAFQGVNGKVGGVYAPTAPIIVDGLGLTLTAPLQIRGSGLLRLESGATLLLNDGDYQDLGTGHVGRSRSIFQAMAPVVPVGQTAYALTTTPNGGVQPIASTIRSSAGETYPEFVKRIRVHNGATLRRVVVHFKVPTVHGSVPQRMPRIRVYRVSLTTGESEDLATVDAGDGWVEFTRPTSAAGWNQSGAKQDFTVTLDKNNVINTGAYNYFVHIQEEIVGVREPPLSVKVYERTIVTASTAGNALDGTCDGVAQGIGYLCLFKDEPDKSYNGVYVSPGVAGIWARVSDLSTQAHFENGMLFPTVPSYTSAGLRNPFTVWQMVISDDFTLGSSPISFRRPIAYGTHFIGLTTEFDSITTTSFQ